MADATNKVVRGAQITHIGNGASLAPGAISASSASSVSLNGTNNLSSYPLCDIVLMIAPTASIAAASTAIYLYRRDLNVDGANNEPTPATSNQQKYMGTFKASATTTASVTQYLQLTDVPLPGGADCAFHIENGLGVNIPAGWTLKVTPKADVGATT